MLNRCSENYIETTSKEHVEIPSGKIRQKNFHFQPVCQSCFNATGHIGLTLNQRQNACRVIIVNIIINNSLILYHYDADEMIKESMSLYLYDEFRYIRLCLRILFYCVS